ncbi:hypothetical protein D3C74_496150 [compost metagenome]
MQSNKNTVLPVTHPLGRLAATVAIVLYQFEVAATIFRRTYHLAVSWHVVMTFAPADQLSPL